MIISENENSIGYDNAKRAVSLLNEQGCNLPEEGMTFSAVTDAGNGDDAGATATLKSDNNGPDF